MFLLAPSPEDWPRVVAWLTAGVLVLGPTLAATEPYAAIVLRRMRAYPSLFAAAAKARIDEETTAARSHQMQRLLGYIGPDIPSVPIHGVMLDQEGRLCLVLVKTKGLSVGDQIDCYTLSNFDPLGTFNVTHINEHRCTAAEVRIVDAMWWGSVHADAAMGLLGAPVDTVALVAQSIRKAGSDGR